ncbi:MAG: argininosuccinate synthase [Gammaproteobacteria bacterium]|nr:argininosuccinate synthase [Gammaproteobacteria bacterium]MDH5241615.1 argininosuccinate synthase [Gammaproteobacteria bacterium]MDH5261742.1 argininosuccinate synthase [Gammaproteobacteria bacterium]MDH5583483.1 argininosuccinate synthase [Gammaproteobacteria bacterium]
MSKDTSPIILAFSGGLDTSFCVPWLKKTYGRDVITACVDTGGIDEKAAVALRERALALGAIEHVLIDAKQDFFDHVIRFLIAGNVLRGQAYPLCVGAERGLQAERLAEIALERGATTVAHGCTAAGNDQVRFEVALRTLNPGLEILAPVRDNNWVRKEQLAYLEKLGLPLPAQGSAYSINRGLWGITIGGKETLTSEGSIPESAWVLSSNAFSAPQEPSSHTLAFAAGVPVALDGDALSPVKLIEKLEQLAGGYGIGRGIHLGDTILGTKGRVAYEAPAAITLITAHRELEKLVLSGQQIRIKDSVSAAYGDFVHEGKQLDLACDDIEALLVSSQRRVTGTVRFALRPGQLFIEGTSSPHSLLAATKGIYGESAGEWTASDALGYARILSLPGSLQTRAARSST